MILNLFIYIGFLIACLLAYSIIGYLIWFIANAVLELQANLKKRHAARIKLQNGYHHEK